MMRLAHVAALGPGRSPAMIEFTPGLNVIHGASDTGKSFLVSAIDFMLGARTGLKEIPERQGYDRFVLGVVFSDGAEFTLQRSSDGGSFRVYDGLAVEPKGKPTTLAAKHSATSEKNISRFLLARIGLDGRTIRKSATDVRSLSFRDLAPLTVVPETSIIKEDSPIFSGQYIEKTGDLSVFKLLLTGIDDSAFVTAKTAEDAAETARERLSAVDEVISELRRQIPTDGDPDDDLSRIEAAVDREEAQQHATDAEISQLNTRRAKAWTSREQIEIRQAEVAELVTRFSLLNEHYESDIARLTSIEESGTLLLHFPQTNCPLCGAEPAHQSRESESCDGNVESITEAAHAEIRRIERLRSGLRDTLLDLRREEAALKEEHSKVQRQAAEIQQEFVAFLSSEAGAQRARLAELVERRAALRQQVAILSRVRELEMTREGLKTVVSRADEPKPDTAMPAAAVDEFGQAVRELLTAWHFPASDRVHFERATEDIVVSGKPRSSYGKGLRAITHAAFTVGLFVHCLGHELPHTGLVVLDSPLLAYREPDPDDLGVRASDLKDRFYEAVAAVASRGQVIIVENESPPSDLLPKINAVHFSGNDSVGRYGFFPRVASR